MNDSNLFDPIDEMGAAAKPIAEPDPYAEQPMEGPLRVAGTAEALLKRPGAVLHTLRNGPAGAATGLLLVVALAAMAIYGIVAGSLSGGHQYWAAPLKIVAGSLLSALICLPSLYVFLCLSGVNARWSEVTGSMAAMIALSAILLVGLAPVAWVFSQSTDSVALMGAMHLAFWGVSALMGARLLNRFLGRSQRSARLGGWLAIYLLVCLQMMTALRPILGNADTFLPIEKRFFLQHIGRTLSEPSTRAEAPSERGPVGRPGQ